MKTFREIAILEGSSLEKIKKAFGDKLVPFLDELQLYIDFNDDPAHKTTKFITDHKKELKKAGFLTSPSKVYRLVKLEKKEIGKKPNKKPAYSASTEKLQGNILNLMEDMITSYKAKGDFYYLEIDDCEGLDINAFGKVFQNKEETKDIDQKVLAFFLESIKEKAEQKEFLIFGSYSVDKTVLV